MTAANPMSYGSLDSVFNFLKAHPDKRQAFIDHLVKIEPLLQEGTDVNIREQITGPLVDAMFESGEQLSKSIEAGLRYEFRYSSKIARDFLMASRAKPDHVWEPQTTKALLALAKSSRTTLIGGAYFGDQALLVAKALQTGGHCYCFELSSANIGMLKNNIAINGIDNISVHQLALWSEDDKQITLMGLDSHASPQEAQSGVASGGTVFKSKTIDSFCRDEKIEHLDIIMLDIEGGETAALHGARSMLSQPAEHAPAVICEIHSSYVDWSAGLRTTSLVETLLQHGYEVFALRDYQGNEAMEGRPVELVDIDSAVISGPPHGFNLLAVKSRARLDGDVFRVCSHVSPKLLHHRDASIFAPLPSEQLQRP
ncbi:MAG: FkbM family methyltransferase [Beijerinckiaceae bacterium]|nr:FkbM family methyltransferase [Beijerinckiaceae bacterium]